MSFDSLISGLAEIGGSGKGWRSPVAIAGLVIGVSVGAYIGWQSGALMGALVGIPTGALIGWVLGLVLRASFAFLLIFIVAALVVFGWRWMTGGGA